MKITEDMLEVLASASPDGNLLYLNGQIERKLYEQVDAALNTAGGHWSKGRKAHVFSRPAWDAVMDLTAREEVETAPERRQRTQLFETPADVVGSLISGALLQRRHVVLEPSAGRGAIAQAVARLVDAVDCIEADGDYAAEISAAGYARTVTVRDFLTVTPDPVYDRVIMNPPFTRGQDVAHVGHALRFVRPGGRLIAVMPSSVQSRADKAATAFRGVVDQAHGWYTGNPAESFKDSGTTVNTVIVIIPVAGQDVAATADEPMRVTFDRTAERVPLFDPATAAPGVYIHHDAWMMQDTVFRFRGKCIGCRRPTWAHDHGNDDVRGVFGDYTAMPLDSEDFESYEGADGLDIPADVTLPRCAECWNTGEAYERANRRALAELKRRYGKTPGGAAPRPPVAAAVTTTQLDLFGAEETAA